MNDTPDTFRLFVEIGIIAQLSRTLFERAIPPGMTLAQFSVLNHLVLRGDGKNPVDLARAFQVTKATMTSTLRRLETKGLIALAPDPRDGRAKRVELRPAGRAMRETCIGAMAPSLRVLAAHWPQAETAALLPGLARLRALLDDRPLFESPPGS